MDSNEYADNYKYAIGDTSNRTNVNSIGHTDNNSDADSNGNSDINANGNADVHTDADRLRRDLLAHD
jgi:hypothetical protein